MINMRFYKTEKIIIITPLRFIFFIFYANRVWKLEMPNTRKITWTIPVQIAIQFYEIKGPS